MAETGDHRKHPAKVEKGPGDSASGPCPECGRGTGGTEPDSTRQEIHNHIPLPGFASIMDDTYGV